MEALLYILGFIIAIVVDVIIARAFADVAEDKGHTESKYFWMCVLFGIPGYLLVIALPDRRRPVAHTAPAQTASSQPAYAPHPSYPPVSQPHAPVAGKPQAGSWQCVCGRVNAPYVSSCVCGKSKHNQG